MSIKTILCLLAFFFCKASYAQLLFLDFNETETLGDYVSLSNPSNRFLNAIGTSGAGVQVSISQQMLKYNRTGSNTGAFARSTNFSNTPQTLAIKIQLRITDNSSAQTTAAVFQIGTGFGTTNAAESNASVHSRFGLNFTVNGGEFSLRDLSTSTNSSVLNGLQMLTWVINNSGNANTYRAPNGSLESIANDTWDLWAGNTKLFDDRAALSAALNLEDLKFAFTNGVGAIHIDQLQVDVLPSLNHFRSAVTNGNWHTPSDWEMSTDSLTWLSSSAVPSANAASIFIQANQQINVSGSSAALFCAASNLLIAANAKLHIGLEGDGLNQNINHIFSLAKQNNNVQLSNLGLLQINENATFQCKGILQNNGVLLVKSSSVGTGNIGNSNGGTLTGNVSVERFIPAGMRRNRSLATPIANQTLADWKEEIYITGNGTGNTLGSTNSNGFDATATNNPSVFWYDETVGGSVNLGWVAANHINNALIPGRGYKVLIRGDRSDLGRLNGSNTTQNAVKLISTGTLTQGDFNFPASNITYSGTAADDAWCFIGNPYACAINWQASVGWQRTNVDAGAIATWNPLTNSYAYSINTASGANPSGLSINGGSSIIAAHQAFFVKTTGANPSLSCTENVKVNNPSANLFKNNEYNLIKLSLEKDKFNSDEAIIQFHPSFSEEEIDFEDLPKFNNPIVNIGSGRNPKKWLAFNALPILNNQKFTVPIYASLAEGEQGLLRIEAKNMHSFEDLFLIDLADEKYYEIGEKFTQAFSFTNNAQNTARFHLVGQARFSLSQPESKNESFTVFPNPCKEILYIKAPTDWVGEKIDIQLIDMQGKEIQCLSYLCAISDLIPISLDTCSPGIYTLQVKTTKGIFLKKISKS